MPKRPPLYRNRGSATAPPAAQAGDIDLRAEFDIIIFGDDNNVPHGIPVIVRHYDYDDDGNKIECTCLNQMNFDGDPDCSYCFGDGYISVEKWYRTYKFIPGADDSLITSKRSNAPPGRMFGETIAFFFRYDVPIKEGDKIIEVELDLEGNVVLPFVRTNSHRPSIVDYLRSDNGRVEYIATY